jgi:hypothetical protein
MIRAFWPIVKHCSIRHLRDFAVHIFPSTSRKGVYQIAIGGILISANKGDSTVDIATGYGLDTRGVGVPVGAIVFSCPRRLDRFWGPTHPTIQ